MAITYFNSASTPADNGTSGLTVTSVTPPASMTAGQLVLMIGQVRAASVTFTISQAGGQTWTAGTARSTTLLSVRLFWCRFNGTWTANPSLSGTAAATTVVMHVFTPATAADNWDIDVAEAWATHTGGTVTITGQTTVLANTVTLAGWFSTDDNTWGTLTGTGWTGTGSAQYRNLSGSDQSCAFAHFISSASGTATGNTSLTQATLGPDSGGTLIVTLGEHPISCVQLTNGASPGSTTSIATASISPASTSLVLLCVHNYTAGPVPGTISCSGFTSVQNQGFSTIASPTHRATVLSATGVGTGALTINCTTSDNLVWAVFEISTTDAKSIHVIQSGIGATNNSSTSPLTVTLSAFGSSSAGFYYTPTDNTGSVTPEAGWTSVYDVNGDGATYRDQTTDNTATASIGIASAEAGIALELAASVAYSITITESINAPTDVVTRMGVFARTLSESVGAPTDAVVRVLVLHRTAAESVTAPTDAVSRALTAPRAVAESVAAPTDAVTRVFTGARTATESVPAPTDAVTRLFAGARALAESVAAPTDAVARVLGSGRQATENVNAPTDTVARVFTGAREATENVSAPTDAVSRILGAVRAIGENVGAPTDTVTFVKGTTGFTITVSETVSSPTDSVTRVFIGARAVAEVVTAPTDDVTRALTQTRSVNESVTAPTDSVNRALVMARPLTESISAPTDTVARSLGASRAVAESIAAPTDGVARALVQARSVNESVAAPTDLANRIQTAARAMSESISAPTDTVTRLFSNGRVVTEDVPAPSDAVVRALQLSRTVTEDVPAPTDAPSHPNNYARTITETLPGGAATIKKIILLTDD